MSNIKIEDLGGCNSTITRKMVYFEKRENEYFVYIGVFGFNVSPEFNYKSSLFKDKLPLYMIPESKLEEHIKLFQQTMYNIEVIEK